MANITIEIPEILINDFINNIKIMQVKLYAKQITSKNKEEKIESLNKLMELANILSKMENEK